MRCGPLSRIASVGASHDASSSPPRAIARARTRDLRASFLIEGPQNFWAAEVTDLLARRGYRLVSIESRLVNEIARYPSLAGEGVARFEGAMGPLEVSFHGGEWRLRGGAADLAVHGLDESFADDREFADRVSSYLLSHQRPQG